MISLNLYIRCVHLKKTTGTFNITKKNYTGSWRDKNFQVLTWYILKNSMISINIDVSMDKSYNTTLWQSNYILLFFHFDMEMEGSIVYASDQTHFA